MATRNINNYINELLNEVHEPGHQRERQFFDPTKNPMDGIRDDQKSTKKPLSSEERELAILRAQAKSRTNDMGERLAARKALKAMENQAAPSAPTTTGGMGKEMDKMRDGFLSNLDNFSSGKGITDNLQASGSGKKPKKDTPGREIEKIPVERRPDGGRRPNMEPKPAYNKLTFFPDRRPDDGRPVMEPKPFYHDRRPDDGRPVMEPKPFYHDRRPDDGRYDDIPKPIGKPIEAGTFIGKKPRFSKGGKNKGLARAAQADKTGDAYMDQVMGQGKGTPSSGADVAKEIRMREEIRMRDGARPDSGIRTTDYRPDRDDPIGGYGPAIPRRADLNIGLARAGGPNIMPRQGPARGGGPNIMPDMKRKRMGY